MFAQHAAMKWIIGLGGCVLLGFGILMALVTQGAQSLEIGQDSGCTMPLVMKSPGMAHFSEHLPMVSTTTSVKGATPTATPDD